MDMIETLVVVAHVVVAVALVGLVLIQQGKGADAGAAFGGGASQTVFGSQGSGSFLTRFTTGLAIIFFATSFTLAVFAKNRAEMAGQTGMPSEHKAPTAQQSDTPKPAGSGSETGSGAQNTGKQGSMQSGDAAGENADSVSGAESETGKESKSSDNGNDNSDSAPALPELE